ncbi:MAG TPA: hypothetical protein PKH16_15365 [Aequorivita sp.]|nr:hypothetical protein [Aequorivita sp.]
MTQEEADIRAEKLKNILRKKHIDLIAHIDLIPGTEKIKVSLFWNRKSKDQWNEAKVYNIKASEYENELHNRILKLQ